MVLDDLTGRRGPAQTWLITGVAGFIGSNLLQELLRRGQQVRGLDNFAAGTRSNLDQVQQLVTPEQWSRFEMLEGDIRDPAVCGAACAGCDYVLHHAALGSVPLSLENPALTHEVNVTGTLNMLTAARDRQVRRLVYASSCAVYGDLEALPLREGMTGNLLSPYAATKLMNEHYAAVYSRCYGLSTVGLRYFNIFGPRQDPAGAYAAVIPRWISALLNQQPVTVHGDGETSRDFCYVGNVVEANLRAALSDRLTDASPRVFNIGSGECTSLNQLYQLLVERLIPRDPRLRDPRPIHDDFRPGDIRHSQSDIRLAEKWLDYRPGQDLAGGLDMSLEGYCQGK